MPTNFITAEVSPLKLKFSIEQKILEKVNPATINMIIIFCFICLNKALRLKLNCRFIRDVSSGIGFRLKL
ncbi:hypothetical protein D3C71_2135620 [compost metagenome]